jgi:hypothetical protein
VAETVESSVLNTVCPSSCGPTTMPASSSHVTGSNPTSGTPVARQATSRPAAAQAYTIAEYASAPTSRRTARPASR